MRNLLISFGLCTLGLASMAAAACSAPDPGVGYLGLSRSNVGGTGGSGGGTGNGATEDSGSPSPGGSTPTPTDGGGGGGGGADGGGAAASEDAGTSFLGETTAFNATLVPGTTATASMSAGTVVVPTPTTDCLTCHVAGGTGSPFLAAGFIASTPGGTTGVPNLEVRVYAQGSDAGASGYTDSNGYFWINPPIGGLTGPYNAGARAATGAPVLMPNQQATIDCESSSCHGGTQGPIHYP